MTTIPAIVVKPTTMIRARRREHCVASLITEVQVSTNESELVRAANRTNTKKTVPMMPATLQNVWATQKMVLILLMVNTISAWMKNICTMY